MSAKPGKYISFLPDNLDVPVSHKDQCVLDVALRAGLQINNTCGGFGTCGTCLVYVQKGLEKLGERNEIEAEMAADRGFADHERLACQIEPFPDLVIKIPRSSV